MDSSSTSEEEENEKVGELSSKSSMASIKYILSNGRGFSRFGGQSRVGSFG